MKTDLITIDNQGSGFGEALEETRRAAGYRELDPKSALHLQLLTEELLSLARSVTGEMKGDFWIESEGSRFEMHLATETVMDREKREQLLSAATSRKNEAAGTFLGRLRDAFETAMAADTDYSRYELPEDLLSDLANHPIEPVDTEWDGYEASIMRRVADEVKIGIRGSRVDMTVVKDFDK